ncbi:hypothetical protein AJ80_03740 [Polytolypa hystricis UAMH7299]|uniref:Leucine Rich Repeat domain-containing protein n=1 Tax=Polytolypa hystricis (strain UAMH7299) TaxID=1447883 RepID=A0A2B7Y6U0_POLH7|nr:hypothetical protein AJ80_03740 [Polytolypa hystricis UAMH7299]
MEKLNTEDGQLFIKSLASFVRTHEKALANALQMKRQSTKSIDSNGSSSTSSGHVSSSRSATSSTLAAAFSLGSLSFTSHSVKPAKLTLTPHHVFYLLSRFEELSVPVGPMNIRLENINTEVSSAYVSFLSQPRRSKGDRDSIHSVSSVRSVMSGMSALWSSIGLGSRDSTSKSEKAKAAIQNDLKYLYSAFTKIPCLRLAPDHRARLIRGYEEYPFDTAVPLHSFKNLSALEIIDVDFRSFYGWDRLADQLRSLTLKRANIDDPGDLLTGIVLDDIDKRRRRSTKTQPSPVLGWVQSTSGPQSIHRLETTKSSSAPGSPVTDPGFGTSTSPKGGTPMVRGGSEGTKQHARSGSISPARPTSSKQPSSSRHSRGPSKIKRSGSGSSNSSEASTVYRNGSTSNLLAGILPPNKWRFLRHLSLTENSITTISASSLAPVANTLHSLDLSCNLFTEIPDSLASLTALRSLNLSNCMIESLHSLTRNPLPAITALNLRGNRLRSIAGIERLLSLERLDLRDNQLSDPTEIARLTGIPYIREIWVSGNPFTKTHYGYRVVIFNLFRRTPGFSEDIIIDTTGPGYTEKKQLVERAAEPEAVPVIRPVEKAEPAVDTGRHTYHNQALPVDSRVLQPAPVSPKNEHSVGSSRRKKVHRRRIVELSHGDSYMGGDSTTSELGRPNLRQVNTDPFVTAPSVHHTGSYRDTTSNAPATPDIPVKPDQSQKSATVDPPKGSHLLPAIEGIDWGSGGDVYRQRLEALKNEVGTNWLTVLGDETWGDKQHEMGIHPGGSNFSSPTIRPAPMSRTSSQAIVTGGRTLG